MGRKTQVQAITSVGKPLSEDVHGRAVRYIVSMSIRTACVVGLFFVDGWMQWVMAAGAIVLPYVAVVAANAGRERPTEAATLVVGAELEARTGRPTSTPVDLRGGYLR